jgi:predicted RNase H-like HicB family nuclease
MRKFEKNNFNMKLTIAIAKGEEYFIGTIKEIPAVITQGSTIEEARENVIDALALYLDNMQETNNLSNTVLEEDLMLG